MPTPLRTPTAGTARRGRRRAAVAAAAALVCTAVLGLPAALAPAAVAAPATAPATAADLPSHALVGYLHASFANGSGYVPVADVPDSWDIIDLAFGEPTSATSGDIRFNRCTASECPNVESDADFRAAIKAKQAAGKKVLISIGGANGQVQLTTTAARDAFVSLGQRHHRHLGSGRPGHRLRGPLALPRLR